MIAPLRRILNDIDPQLVLGRPRLLRDEFTRSIGDQRMMATMVGLFGLVALVLAAIGLYGVMAHLAGQRTTEIGIRLALGARRSSIFALMLKDGLRLVAVGSVIGLAAAVAGARYIQNQLFGVTPADPLTFIGVSIILLAVAVAACLIPARRAMRVDPMRALRSA